MMEDPLKIGIAGTGRMGAAIASRLLALDHDVAVWNRTRDKTHKDLRTMLEEARSLGVRLPVTVRTLQCLEEAVGSDFGNRDATMIPAHWLGGANRS